MDIHCWISEQFKITIYMSQQIYYMTWTLIIDFWICTKNIVQHLSHVRTKTVNTWKQTRKLYIWWDEGVFIIARTCLVVKLSRWNITWNFWLDFQVCLYFFLPLMYFLLKLTPTICSFQPSINNQDMSNSRGYKQTETNKTKNM